MKSLRLDGYPRVSKVGGRKGEGFISPQVQAESMTKWANARGHQLTLHPPELDQSGGTMNRPTFNTIMDRIQTGQTDGLLVYKVDRFARSLLGALTTLETIASHGGTFASVSDNLDLTTAQGRAFLQMQLVFAELFREQIKESFATATSRAVARGVHIANIAPPGYDKGENQILVPNRHAPVLREMFMRRIGGDGPSVLGRYLDDALPRRNGEHWTPAHVRTLLSMRVYTGEAHYGNQRNPDAHEAIVTTVEFERARIMPAPSPSRSGKTHLLAGLIRCAGCRYLMTPGRSGADGQTLVYRCRQKHTAGQCPAPATIVRARVEQYVEEEYLAQMQGRSQDGLPSTPDLEQAIERLEAIRADNQAFALDTDMRALLGDEYEAVKRQRLEAQREAEQAVQASSGPASMQVDVEGWHGWGIAEKRLALAAAIDVVFVRKMSGKPPAAARTLILGRGEGPDDLPRRGRANGPVRGFGWSEDVAGMAAGED